MSAISLVTKGRIYHPEAIATVGRVYSLLGTILSYPSFVELDLHLPTSELDLNYKTMETEMFLPPFFEKVLNLPSLLEQFVLFANTEVEVALNSNVLFTLDLDLINEVQAANEETIEVDLYLVDDVVLNYEDKTVDISVEDIEQDLNLETAE